MHTLHPSLKDLYVDCWIKALTSGLYRHTTTCLHPTPNTFCIFGVLCDLFVRKNKFTWANDYSTDYFKINRYAYRMPPVFRHLLQITDPLERQLIYANDNNNNFDEALWMLQKHYQRSLH
jgi:hypothetical protein